MWRCMAPYCISPLISLISIQYLSQANILSALGLKAVSDTFIRVINKITNQSTN